MPPVRVFLFLAVWAPSALILLGCYVYVYLVARAHARAIYTVELSFRNQTQTLALPRYGQTLAVTVGAFFVLWLPFQTCMLVDTFFGTNILSNCTVWLGLPILAHSGTNPWIYAFHHGEIRLAAGKIAEDLVSLFGVTPSRYYGCSPRRGSQTNLELGEVNSCNEERRPAVEDCFAANKLQFQQQQSQPLQQIQSVAYPSSRIIGRGSELSSTNQNQNHNPSYGKPGEISPERADCDSSSDSYRQTDVVEEDIHDLTRMLDPKFIIDRQNHIIDSNHNIDKIKNLKYLLDPTFSKIRHLRRLNYYGHHHHHQHQHQYHLGNNGRIRASPATRFRDTRFVSYQNLDVDSASCGGGTHDRVVTPLHLNAMSDPMLNADDSPDGTSVAYAPLHDCGLYRHPRALSASTSNVLTKEHHHQRQFPYSVRALATSPVPLRQHQQSQQQHQHHRRSFTWARARQRFAPAGGGICFESANSPPLDLKFQPYNHRYNHQSSYTSLPTPDGGVWSSSCRSSPKLRSSFRQLTITPNRLASLLNEREQPVAARTEEPSQWSERPLNAGRFLEPRGDNLRVPAIHSEPPSPIVEPLPALDALQEEDSCSRSTADVTRTTSFVAGTSLRSRASPARSTKSPTRHSDPVVAIPSVLLNIEDCSSDTEQPEQHPEHQSAWTPSTSPISPRELSNYLLMRFTNGQFDNSDNENSCSNGIIVNGGGNGTSDWDTSPYHCYSFKEHDYGCSNTRFSSRRPSDSKWSESSRSQEVLSTSSALNELQPRCFPSSYSVNSFQQQQQQRNAINNAMMINGTAATGAFESNDASSDLNELTSSRLIEPFLCSDAALSSSLRESVFGAPSMPDSEDIFASFEEAPSVVTTPEPESRPDSFSPQLQRHHVSSVSLLLVKRPGVGSTNHQMQPELQSKSTESMFRDREQSERLRALLEPGIHRSRPRVRQQQQQRIAPLASPTPTDVCTPTFDLAAEAATAAATIATTGVGVAV